MSPLTIYLKVKRTQTQSPIHPSPSIPFHSTTSSAKRDDIFREKDPGLHSSTPSSMPSQMSSLSISTTLPHIRATISIHPVLARHSTPQSPHFNTHTEKRTTVP
ncbi:hypothetical protein P280DRAFT_55460 [Massarina eburnea CBS 473.64]|uniref:Uncharacterized protein n=1 Tax=Massarina eburnea CBS 473.64 TaxID=1395130 RepID=A0A6A6RWN2_9PLEO|nr:hypothetical protein P280DRAFT_55460 [Massarina eburnea CBS 473.64]